MTGNAAAFAAYAFGFLSARSWRYLKSYVGDHVAWQQHFFPPLP